VVVWQVTYLAAEVVKFHFYLPFLSEFAEQLRHHEVSHEEEGIHIAEVIQYINTQQIRPVHIQGCRDLQGLEIKPDC